MKRSWISFAALTACGALVACGSTQSTSSGTDAKKTADGLVAFETVRSVLQHPRCQNCHPRGDVPLQGDDSHPHLQNVQRGPDGQGMVGERCSTCHGPANPPDAYGKAIPPGSPSGWRMPKPDERLVFVGVPAGALCEQIKDPKRNGGKDMAALRHHLDDPLVTWGWNPGFGRAPIPVPRETFLAAWQTWADAGTPCPK
jgi:hypothetical protein